ncbi:DUF4278 domain-containing protein [Gloeothece verrucosa]|uniref:Uncharacterized protein n=1 Tax=Gloeothece verrucosa (strain PCC 7822) TaxID=497965 RepID=E0U8R6_GLOV7|nr:hypothetical protein [Gloeothece verrucosa]ADN14930.1 hypothetical protein Cyan7822_2973 [Gloeothece verrucosa PCC 7822]
MTNEEAVYCIFLMRFNLQPLQAITIVKNWFNEHPEENWVTLKQLFQEDQLTVINGKIKKVLTENSSDAKPVVSKYRGVEIEKNISDFSQENSPIINRKPTKYRGAEIPQENPDNMNYNPPGKKKLRYRGQEY